MGGLLPPPVYASATDYPDCLPIRLSICVFICSFFSFFTSFVFGSVWQICQLSSVHWTSLSSRVVPLTSVHSTWTELNWSATTRPSYTTRSLFARVSVTTWLAAAAKLGRLVLSQFARLNTPDMELGHWVNGSSFTSVSPGHRVIILTRCETRLFPVFEKNAQNAKRTFAMLK